MSAHQRLYLLSKYCADNFPIGCRASWAQPMPIWKGPGLCLLTPSPVETYAMGLDGYKRKGSLMSGKKDTTQTSEASHGLRKKVLWGGGIYGQP